MCAIFKSSNLTSMTSSSLTQGTGTYSVPRSFGLRRSLLFFPANSMPKVSKHLRILSFSQLVQQSHFSFGFIFCFKLQWNHYQFYRSSAYRDSVFVILLSIFAPTPAYSRLLPLTPAHSTKRKKKQNNTSKQQMKTAKNI